MMSFSSQHMMQNEKLEGTKRHETFTCTIIQFLVHVNNTVYQSIEYTDKRSAMDLIETCHQLDPMIMIAFADGEQVLQWHDMRISVTHDVSIEDLYQNRRYLAPINIFIQAFSSAVANRKYLDQDAKLFMDCIRQMNDHELIQYNPSYNHEIMNFHRNVDQKNKSRTYHTSCS